MKNLIELKNLTIRSDEKTLVKLDNLEIEKGDFLSIAGPSGSGKSTLLKYLAQMNDPKLDITGKYFYDGVDVENISVLDLRRKVSYFYQNPVLFGETVKDNMIFPYEIRNMAFDENKAIKLLENVDLSESFLNAQITSLSGGEKQRVALARNLLFLPEVLLLDEITSSLDIKTKEIIWHYLYKLKNETEITIVMVSHDIKEQKAAEKIITLEKVEH